MSKEIQRNNIMPATEARTVLNSKLDRTQAAELETGREEFKQRLAKALDNGKSSLMLPVSFHTEGTDVLLKLELEELGYSAALVQGPNGTQLNVRW